jgi:DNA-binding MarR family transcriptional regulator
VSIQVKDTATQSVSDAARLSLALSRISRWIRRQQTLPLGHGALSALATISREGPLRLGDLAAREGLAAPSLSRIIAVLVVEGYVDRRPDHEDGRSWLVSITATGDQLLAQLRASSAGVLIDRLATLDLDQRAAIVAALPALEALAADAWEAPHDVASTATSSAAGRASR